jgi:deoxyribodipyrimidine photolyase-related protein
MRQGETTGGGASPREGRRARGLFLLPGSHLFAVAFLREAGGGPVFMAEDVGLCTRIRHHQQKLVLFLAAMRSHRDLLRRCGLEVIYHELGEGRDVPYVERLEREMAARGVEELTSFEIEDRFFDAEIGRACARNGVTRRVLPSPMFLTGRSELIEEIGGGKTPRMADFYRWQRERLGVLIDPDGSPTGGRWSFDTENRRPLPKGLTVPPAPRAAATRHVRAVSRLVAERFGDHPGTLEGFDWPTTRGGARRWLRHFVEHRLPLFGPYEDAMSSRDQVLFHSRLSPLMNCGLLTPAEVLEEALAARDRVPPASLEGFVRQVIGWREFIRGVDLLHGDRQALTNTWGHERTLRGCWWTGGTGVPPLDDMIRTCRTTGWAHHIQRLMVAGNIMTLCGVHPAQAWRWFMEMFVDSAEWVMGPNVFGMGICSDGGVFATKPYICGSNYLLKMSDYARGDWCDGLDGLYWGFIERHRERLARNARMGNVVRSLDRLDPGRRGRIMEAGRALRERLTAEPTGAGPGRKESPARARTGTGAGS